MEKITRVAIFNEVEFKMIDEAFKLLNESGLSEEYYNRIFNIKNHENSRVIRFLKDDNNISLMTFTPAYTIKINDNLNDSLNSMVSNWNFINK